MNKNFLTNNKNFIYHLIYTNSMEFTQKVTRYPTLDTVLMIEKIVEKSRGNKTKRELWLALPRKVMWQTFVTTLEYLENSGKILVNNDKYVFWIYDPKLIEKLKKQGLVVR